MYVVHVVHVFWPVRIRQFAGGNARIASCVTQSALLGLEDRRRGLMQELTKDQLAVLLDRLNDGGCPVQRDHGYKISPVGLSIEKIPGLGCSEMFDLTQGGTGC